MGTKAVLSRALTDTQPYPSFISGLGGGMMLDSIYGKVRIGGRYSHNQASDGGGVHVAQVLLGGYLDINAAFESNEAVEMGYGARGMLAGPGIVLRECCRRRQHPHFIFWPPLAFSRVCTCNDMIPHPLTHETSFSSSKPLHR